jgi:hypothetical protein
MVTCVRETPELATSPTRSASAQRFVAREPLAGVEEVGCDRPEALNVCAAGPLLRQFLEGVTAAVVGLIAETTISLVVIATATWKRAPLFVAAL